MGWMITSRWWGGENQHREIFKYSKNLVVLEKMVFTKLKILALLAFLTVFLIPFTIAEVSHPASQVILKDGVTNLQQAIDSGAFGKWQGTTDIYYNGGNVGIGTPTPGAKLHVVGGEVRIPGGSYGGSNPQGWETHFNYYNDNKNYIRGTTVMADTGGNVGIGTTNPDTKLVVNGDIRVMGSNKILLGDPGTGEYIYSQRSGYYPIIFHTGGSDSMVILNTGNVGIGTTTPNAKLEVNGNINAVGTISSYAIALDNGAARINLINDYKPDTSARTWTLYNVGGTYGDRFAIYSYDSAGVHQRLSIYDNGNTILAQDGGNVGIGTSTPGAKLGVYTGGGTGASMKLEHIGSNFIVRPASSGGSSTVIENTGGGGLLINPNGGNVGIGTNTPRGKLDVVGGDVYFGDPSIGPANLNIYGNLIVSNGYIQLPKSASAPTTCDATHAGEIYFDTDNTEGWPTANVQFPCVCTNIVGWSWNPTVTVSGGFTCS